MISLSFIGIFVIRSAVLPGCLKIQSITYPAAEGSKKRLLEQSPQQLFYFLQSITYLCYGFQGFLRIHDYR